MKIKDICDLQNGRAFKPSEWETGGLPIIRIQNLNDVNAPFNYYSGEYSCVHEVNDGELLFSWSGTPGTSFGAFRWYRGKGILNQHIFRVIPKIDIDKNYLMYALNGNLNKIIAKAHGGVGLQHITKKELDLIDVPVVSMENQLVIISTLDKLQSIITHRKQQLEQLDLLVKARFVEMFGNFVFEKDRWQKCSVGDVAGTVDPQPSHRTPPIDADGIPYIGIAECNYQSRSIDFDSARKVGKNVLEEHIARYDLHKGDFIIGKIGTIGKPFFIPSERFYTLSANTVLIQPNSEMIVPQFLFSIFQSEYMDRIIDAEKKSTSQPAFGIQKVRAIEIPLPPLELQNQFAAFVEQTDKSKFSAVSAPNSK